MDWNTRYATRTEAMKRSTIREILKLTAQPDVISFAGGLPAPEYFPIERAKAAAETVLSERGQEALQYSTSEGMPELRDLIADRLSTQTMKVTRDNIIILNGSQQGLDLVGRILLNEGDKVIIENPSYLGMLMAWKPFGVEFLPVTTDLDGLIPAELDAYMRQHPKMMNVAPNFQNPQGITLSYERRLEVVKAISQYEVPLVEDNAYSELRYSGDPLPPLLHIDAEHNNLRQLDGHVIYIGTFSKVLTPGLRIGWVAAPLPIIDKIVQAKQSADLHTSTLTQFITYEMARDGFLDQHIAHLRDVYRERRDVMLAAMEQYFPEGVRWIKPEGGLFLTVWLPDHMDSRKLLEKAVTKQVAFIPGEDFFIGGIGSNTMRLNFSNAKPEMIEEGIRRLGALIKENLVEN